MKKLTHLLLFIFVLCVTTYASDFVPRLSAPSESSPYYTSLNVFHQFGFGMAANGGNCTCYAYGRAYEILGSKPSLSTGSAGKWYDYNKSGGYYSYGSEPAVGAIAVWKSTTGGAGHVAVVEKIEGDIAITSESGWNSYYFKTVRRNIKSLNFGASSGYAFQGFIYILENDVPKINARVKKTGNYIVAEINLQGVYEECNIIVSSYKNGRLVQAEIIEHTGEEKSVTLSGNADTIKVMVWNENNAMKPLCEELEITQNMWK